MNVFCIAQELLGNICIISSNISTYDYLILFTSKISTNNCLLKADFFKIKKIARLLLLKSYRPIQIFLKKSRSWKNLYLRLANTNSYKASKKKIHLPN